MRNVAKNNIASFVLAGSNKTSTQIFCLQTETFHHLHPLHKLLS